MILLFSAMCGLVVGHRPINADDGIRTHRVSRETPPCPPTMLLSVPSVLCHSSDGFLCECHALLKHGVYDCFCPISVVTHVHHHSDCFFSAHRHRSSLSTSVFLYLYPLYHRRGRLSRYRDTGMGIIPSTYNIYLT